MLNVTKTLPAPVFLDAGLSPGSNQRRILRALGRRSIAIAGLAVLTAWIGLGLLAPFLPIADPNELIIADKLLAPSLDHYFGTDEAGRDVFSRVIYAARVSLPSSLLIVALSVMLGSIIGAIAAGFGGTTDQVIMRICDAVLSLPSIILAMAVATIRGGPGLENVIIAVVIVLWPEYARLMRGEVLRLKERDFVLAARAAGATSTRVFLRHILPGANAPVIVKATLDAGGVILLTASLSFLGFGAVPPTAEWGAMVSQGARAGLQFWWASAFPGLAIISVVMALNFLGDSLRDALDPRN